MVFITAAVLLTANTLYSAPKPSSQALFLVLTGAILYPLFNGQPAEEDDAARESHDDLDE
jgi:hypothetical protein